MIELLKYTCDNKQEWDNLISSSRNGTFIMYRDYMDYHSERYLDHSFIILKNGKIEAVIPGNIHNSTFYSHQGLTYGGLISTVNISTIDVLDIYNLLNIELQKLNVEFAIFKLVPSIYHTIPCQEDIYALFRNRAEKIGSSISTTILLSNKLKFKELRKRGIQKSIKEGIIVSESDNYSEFWKILTTNLLIMHNEKPTHSLKDIILLTSRFPDNIKLYVARQIDKIIAGTIIYITKKVIHVQYIGSTAEAKRIGALDLIFDELINRRFDSEYFFDFGISTVKNGIFLNEGLIFQKEGFGGRGIVYETYKYKIPEKKIPMNLIERYGIVLRLVELDDADFIFKLRTNTELNKFISYTSLDIADQIKWIQVYKCKEKRGLEYYFIVQDQSGNKYGTIRLYNFDGNSFEIGSWLFSNPSPIGMAVKAHFIGFETGFELFNVDYCKFEIRKDNKGVLRYMQDFKTTLVKEDDLNFYFTLTKENFLKRRSQLSIFNSSSEKQENKTFIHPSAEVQSNNIGKGTSIWQFCVILKDAVIGKNCNINYNVFIENDVIIGNNATIKSGVQLWDGLRIEDNVFISPNVAFTNDFAPRSKQYPNRFLTTLIKEGASIGANSTVIGGITIGRYAMIGAGSVLTKNVPDFNLWYGHPASFKSYICKCGQKLNNLFFCNICNLQYKSTEGKISEL